MIIITLQDEETKDVNDTEETVNMDGDARTVEARDDSNKEGLQSEENEKKIIRVSKAEPKEGKKVKDGKKTKKKREDKENKDKESKTESAKALKEHKGS